MMMLDEQGGYQGERQEHGEQSHQASSGTSSCGHYDWSDGGPVSIRDDDVLSVLLSGAGEPLRWPDWLKIISIITPQPDFITNIRVHLLCYCQLSHLPLKVKC